MNYSPKAVWDECFNLLADPSVTELQANGPKGFFVKRNGRREPFALTLPNDEEYTNSVLLGLLPHIKNINETTPKEYLLEGPLFLNIDGQEIRGRVHIVMPPAADVPQVTIAKKNTTLTTLDSIAAGGSMSLEMLNFLKACMTANLTMCFSGGSGSGKTTMLEACTRLIPDSVRIGVAEDTPELVLSQSNVTYLHSVPWRPGIDSSSVADLSWVVQQFQRMRTDRLIVGETRGKEFAAFLTAANSGMQGSLTTIHANSPVRCLTKMANFALAGSGHQSMRVINSDIGNAVNIIVQLAILPNGDHKIEAIQEVTPVLSAGEDATLATNNLYTYRPERNQFFRENYPTDNLRKLFVERGIKTNFTSEVGQGQIPHGTKISSESGPVSNSGLPIYPSFNKEGSFS